MRPNQISCFLQLRTDTVYLLHHHVSVQKNTKLQLFIVNICMRNEDTEAEDGINSEIKNTTDVQFKNILLTINHEIFP